MHIELKRQNPFLGDDTPEPLRFSYEGREYVAGLSLSGRIWVDPADEDADMDSVYTARQIATRAKVYWQGAIDGGESLTADDLPVFFLDSSEGLGVEVWRDGASITPFDVV